MKIGYARVSTDEQNLDLQRRALEAAGCEKIFEDYGVSGTAIERDSLTQALGAVGPGDVLVVWKLDQLDRSLGCLVGLTEKLAKTARSSAGCALKGISARLRICRLKQAPAGTATLLGVDAHAPVTAFDQPGSASPKRASCL